MVYYDIIIYLIPRSMNVWFPAGLGHWQCRVAAQMTRIMSAIADAGKCLLSVF
jgi:hypothetical protein